ncbi:AAA family ATPase [Devosia riboflavina]
MRVSRVQINSFRRFSSLIIAEIPETARLVVLAGPNGSGKSSLLDAFLLRYRMDASVGYHEDPKYYDRGPNPNSHIVNRISIEFHGGVGIRRGAIYVRSAYRNDPEFETSSLTQQGSVLDVVALSRLIQTDATVASNYQRLASQAMQDLFVDRADTTTFGEYRDWLIGQAREPLKRLFPDLTFLGIGNPLNKGSFQFEKGSIRGFDYKNLSGGEKAAFDLILDIVVKRESYGDAIYLIDEPETHMNTRVQGALLEQLLGVIPENSQLWIASHSIGMMRKARELFDKDPSSVVFLDFSQRDFDEHVRIEPSRPNRQFWESVMRVALDDLAALVAPQTVVICEGNPAGAVPGKNAEHDSRIYNTIFSDEFSDTVFLAAGNAKEVAGDYLGLAAAIPKVAAGIAVKRLIDRDDHSDADVAELRAKDISVLSRRHLELYLYDDEVLAALCAKEGKSSSLGAVIAARDDEIAASVGRQNPPDDIKKAASGTYVKIKRILGLTQVGDDASAFARNVLAPLITPGMTVYEELKADVFG